MLFPCPSSMSKNFDSLLLLYRREFGASPKELQAAARQATIIRKKRQQSIRVAMNPSKLNNDNFHESIERSITKVKGMFTRLPKSVRYFRRMESELGESANNIRRASVFLATIALLDPESTRDFMRAASDHGIETPFRNPEKQTSRPILKGSSSLFDGSTS